MVGSINNLTKYGAVSGLLLAAGCTLFDKSPPEVSIVFPATGDVVFDTVMVQAQVSDDTGELVLHVDGMDIATISGTPWELMWDTAPNADDDLHSLVLTATDDAGNTGTSDTIWVTVDKYPQWTVFDSSDYGIANLQPWVIAEGPDGIIWVGTSWQGLLKFDGMTWTHYTSSNSGLPNDFIGGIAFDSDGDVWLATDGGLAQLSAASSTWNVYNTANSQIPSDELFSVAIGPDQSIWIGTNLDGIVSFDGTNWSIFNRQNSGLYYSRIYDMAFDPNGSLWMASDGGVQTFDGQNWNIFDPSNSAVPGGDIIAIDIDSQGHIWISGPDGFLEYDGSTWLTHTTPFGSSLGENSITVGPDDTIWSAESQRLDRFDRSEWRSFDSTNSRYPVNSTFYPYASTIMVSPGGALWAGFWRWGLLRFEQVD